MFTTKSGYPVEPRNLARSFHRIAEDAQLRRIRLHDLRHTTATLLKDLSVPPRDTTELEIYTAADDASRRDAIERLNDLFKADPK